jgi:hypothetical protein
MRLTASLWCLLWAAGSDAGPARYIAARTAAALDGFLTREDRYAAATPPPPSPPDLPRARALSTLGFSDVTLPSSYSTAATQVRYSDRPDYPVLGLVGSDLPILDDLTATPELLLDFERIPLPSERPHPRRHDDSGYDLDAWPAPVTSGQRAGQRAGIDHFACAAPWWPESDTATCSVLAPGPPRAPGGVVDDPSEFSDEFFTIGFSFEPSDMHGWVPTDRPPDESWLHDPLYDPVCPTDNTYGVGNRTCGPVPPLQLAKPSGSVIWRGWPPTASYRRAWDEICLYVAFCPAPYDYHTTRKQRKLEIVRARRAYSNFAFAACTGCSRELRERDPYVCVSKADMLRLPWTRRALLKNPQKSPQPPCP